MFRSICRISTAVVMLCLMQGSVCAAELVEPTTPMGTVEFQLFNGNIIESTTEYKLLGNISDPDNILGSIVNTETTRKNVDPHGLLDPDCLIEIGLALLVPEPKQKTILCGLTKQVLIGRTHSFVGVYDQFQSHTINATVKVNRTVVLHRGELNTASPGVYELTFLSKILPLILIMCFVGMASSWSRACGGIALIATSYVLAIGAHQLTGWVFVNLLMIPGGCLAAILLSKEALFTPSGEPTKRLAIGFWLGLLLGLSLVIFGAQSWQAGDMTTYSLYLAAYAIITLLVRGLYDPWKHHSTKNSAVPTVQQDNM